MLTHLDHTTRLTKDLKEAAITLSDDEARYLVDYYYICQEDRKRASNQERALSETTEPHQLISWLKGETGTLEKQIARALDAYSASKPIGDWARSVCGIGPIISAGLMAHIDIEKAPTAGHIWRFAGLDPTNKWEKGKKRPWNASLKTLCWKIGESFVKVSGNDNDIYGKVYAKRKELEIQRNEAGEFSDQAKAVLESVPGHAQKAIYKEGKLPPGHLHARAKRYAVKLFLSHWHHKAYEFHYGNPPPFPYPIAILGHAHYVPPH